MDDLSKRYVNGLLFDKDYKRVALIQKIKPDWQAGKFNAIGGKIEYGETPQEAMNREFIEETELELIYWSWSPFLKLHHINKDSTVYFFRNVGPLELLKSPTKEKVSVFGVGCLPDNMILNMNWIVYMAMDPYAGARGYMVEVVYNDGDPF